MATRFYFDGVNNSPVNSFGYVVPDAGWEQSTTALGAGAVQLVRKNQVTALLALNSGSTRNIPITTTQDICWKQYFSEPIATGGLISGTISAVIKCSVAATTGNATLAMVVKVVSNDGSTSRGTLFSVFGTDTAFPATASAATRIVNAQALTTQTAQRGDRILVELGAHAAAPSSTTSYSLTEGFDGSADYALTSALTTALTPWVEFSQNLFDNSMNNYQQFKAGNGISVSEKIY